MGDWIRCPECGMLNVEKRDEIYECVMRRCRWSVSVERVDRVRTRFPEASVSGVLGLIYNDDVRKTA